MQSGPTRTMLTGHPLPPPNAFPEAEADEAKFREMSAATPRAAAVSRANRVSFRCMSDLRLFYCWRDVCLRRKAEIPLGSADTSCSLIQLRGFKTGENTAAHDQYAPIRKQRC